MAINKPTLTQYADNFSIDIFKTNDTLNLFSDASMRTVSKKDHMLASSIRFAILQSKRIMRE